jgi:hypothetical protein
MSDNNIINALITSSISIGMYGAYKLINNYRLHSECNKNNELIISVVDKDIEKQVKQSPALKPAESPNIELPPLSLNPLH